MYCQTFNARLGLLTIAAFIFTFGITFFFLTMTSNVLSYAYTLVSNSTIKREKYLSSSYHNLVRFESNVLSFKYPPYWNPQQMQIAGESGSSMVFLGIGDEVGEQSVGFYPVEFTSINPADSIYEEEITISGNKGKKWIRLGEGFVAYDYFSPGIDGQGSFGLHVTLPLEDKILEPLLDAVVATIEFK